MNKKYYIAYGSNLNIERMAERCPKAQVAGTAELNGYELVFKGSKSGSYLTLIEKENGKVPVGIWEITEDDEKALDRYEGYPVFYYKKKIPVQMKEIKNGEIKNINAMIYIMHEDRPFGLPSDYYIETCIKGYRDFKFSIKHLADSIIATLEKMGVIFDEK